MKKMSYRWIAAALGAGLAWGAFAVRPAMAQLQTGEIASAARIYGYNLAAGNWTLEQVQCSMMPNVSLLHYRETFSDGTESRLTAVVPLAGGHVQIVPVLYRNATPFLPAPRNPRNYALFNQLVRGSAAKGTWVSLSACYAALTGAGSGLHSEIGIAGAPKPTVHVDSQGKIHRVTFATRDGESSYMVWSVSFDRFGRVTDVSTEDESVYAAKAPPPVVPRAARKHQEPAAVRQAAQQIRNSQEPDAAMPPAPPPVISQATEEAPPQPPSSSQAGWKFIPTPPAPHFKIIPEPSQPSEAVLPQP